MSGRKWAVAVVTAVVVAAVVVVFLRVGLDASDKFASVIGAVAALVTLGLTVGGLTSRSSSAQSVTRTRVRGNLRQETSSGRGVDQSVRRSKVDGDLDQRS